MALGIRRLQSLVMLNPQHTRIGTSPALHTDCADIFVPSVCQSQSTDLSPTSAPVTLIENPLVSAGFCVAA